MKKEELTIQEVAECSGLSVHTLRYYERIGLLDPVERATSGHRRYSAGDLEWLGFLAYLRSTGMSIRQMQICAKLRRGGDATWRERLAFLEEHRELMQEQMRKLEDNLAYIDGKIAYLRSKLASEEVVLARS
jgi:DNA-binding transcriptional MerR regulator